MEWKPMNTCEILDETEFEDGDRVTDAPIDDAFSLYRPWYIVFAPSPTDATSILVALEPYDKHVLQSAVILCLSAPTAPVATLFF